MKTFPKFILLLFVILLYNACQSDKQQSDGNDDQNSHLTQVQKDSIAASKPGSSAVVVNGPNDIVIGTWERIGKEYRIFSGGNKFESFSRDNNRGIMLNDRAEAYTITDKADGTGFTMVETATDRILWNVTIEDKLITFNHEWLPTPGYIQYSENSHPKAVYNNQAYSTLYYNDGVHQMGMPQGNITIEGQPYSIAYTIFGLGIAIAPPHQLILLLELMDRGF